MNYKTKEKNNTKHTNEVKDDGEGGEARLDAGPTRRKIGTREFAAERRHPLLDDGQIIDIHGCDFTRSGGGVAANLLAVPLGAVVKILIDRGMKAYLRSDFYRRERLDAAP